jgi:hypothetical protein
VETLSSRAIVAMGQRARFALMNPYPSAIRLPSPGQTRPLRENEMNASHPEAVRAEDVGRSSRANGIEVPK